MTKLRAFSFNALFYSSLILYLSATAVTLIMPGEIAFKAFHQFVRYMFWLQRLFGMEIEIRGQENIASGGGIVAAKHQSVWETVALFGMVTRPAFIYKKELDAVPLVGLFLRRLGQISIDRSGKAGALRAMVVASGRAIGEGRHLIIFPEGTRKKPGAPPDYKFGVAKLYAQLGEPVTPVALNSGMFWSSYFWRGIKGRMIIEVLPPITPGLAPEAFFDNLVHGMEAANDRLLLETAKALPARAVSDLARQRIIALNAAGLH